MKFTHALTIKSFASRQNSDIGYLIPIFVETEDGDKYPADTHFECDSKRIFVIGGYSSIDKNFRENQIFRVPIRENNSYEDKKSQNQKILCKFIANGDSLYSEEQPKKIDDKELIEIIESELPSPNNPLIITNTSPLTRYIAIAAKNGSIYFLFDYKNEDSTDTSVLTLKIPQTPLMQVAIKEFNTRQIFKSDAKKLSDHLLKSNGQVGNRRFIKNINVFLKKEQEYEDFISDLELIDTGFQMIERTSPSLVNKNQISLYKKNFQSKYRSGSQPYLMKLLDRFFNTLENFDSYSNNIDKYRDSFFNTKDGKRLIEKYIDETPQIYEKLSLEIKKRLSEDSEKEKIKLDQQLNDLKLKAKEANEKIAELNRLREIKEKENQETEKNINSSMIQKEFQKESLQLNKDLANKKQELEKIQNELDKKIKNWSF